MSSDKLSSVQEPVLSLDMDVQSNSDRQTVSVELSREDLKKLITSLEAANKVSNKQATILILIKAPTLINPPACFPENHLQSTFSGSNTDGSFTTALLN